MILSQPLRLSMPTFCSVVALGSWRSWMYPRSQVQRGSLMSAKCHSTSGRAAALRNAMT